MVWVGHVARESDDVGRVPPGRVEGIGAACVDHEPPATGVQLTCERESEAA